jgi:peroxiredoxin
MPRGPIVMRGWLVTLVAVVALGLSGCSRKPRGPVELAKLDFTLKDMTGRDVRLADFKGKPIIVNFWATWCGPCQIETPELVDLAAKYKDRGLVVLGISYDDTPDAMQKFAAEYQVAYPLLVGKDRTDVTDAFGLGAALPMSVFIKCDGTVQGRLEGIATTSWLEKKIQTLF